MSGQLVPLEPCAVPCRGQSCCNCCGQAPALHRIDGGRWFDRWDAQCCLQTHLDQRDQCMHLQGKTREEWMEEDFT